MRAIKAWLEKYPKLDDSAYLSIGLVFDILFQGQRVLHMANNLRVLFRKKDKEARDRRILDHFPLPIAYSPDFTVGHFSQDGTEGVPIDPSSVLPGGEGQLMMIF